MKKTKLLLPALTLSMLGTAIGGGCLVAAAAEPQARDGEPTVGEFISWDGLTFNGTSEDVAENKTVIHTLGGGMRCLIPVSGVTSSMSVELSLTANAQTALQFYILDAGGGAIAGVDPVNATLEAGVAYTNTIPV
ncbi:MAG: hypothetical protein K2J30_06005, partial [Clostridia bacterium]|nr:hypothetical protein [Clostridia bacterium]